MSKDLFGDRIKQYESTETSRRLIPGLPICARIDGRAFSKFTKGMMRPFDKTMSNAMQEVTYQLVKQTNAKLGYTQSDEINLIWDYDLNKNFLFNGKIFKLTSICAAIASTEFLKIAIKNWPRKVAQQTPIFDCRIFQLPNKMEATNTILWREADATKNAISMAAREYFSTAELFRKKGGEMQEMLFQKGINFNDYPAFFKRGTYFQNRKILRTLTSEELKKIPKKYQPEGPIERSAVVKLEMPIFTKIINRVEVIFDEENPKLRK